MLTVGVGTQQEDRLALSRSPRNWHRDAALRIELVLDDAALCLNLDCHQMNRRSVSTGTKVHQNTPDGQF
jgi:hypothetical protein